MQGDGKALALAYQIKLDILMHHSCGTLSKRIRNEMNQATFLFLFALNSGANLAKPFLVGSPLKLHHANISTCNTRISGNPTVQQLGVCYKQMSGLRTMLLYQVSALLT